MDWSICGSIHGQVRACEVKVQRQESLGRIDKNRPRRNEHISTRYKGTVKISIFQKKRHLDNIEIYTVAGAEKA